MQLSHFDSQVGVRRLSSLAAVRTGFRDRARKFRDALMGCHNCPRSAFRASLHNVTRNATANSTMEADAAKKASRDDATKDPAMTASIGKEAPSKGGGRASGKRGRKGGREGLGSSGEIGQQPTDARLASRLDDFAAVTEAYRVLSDPVLKRRYEVRGVRGLGPGSGPRFDDPLRDPYKLEMTFATGSFKMDFG
jgi:hypothetical protein